MEVTKAIVHPLHGTDLVVDAFEFSIGDAIDPSIENRGAKAAQGFGEGRQQRDSGLCSPTAPVVKERGHVADVLKAPKRPQFLFEVVSDGQRLVEFEGLLQIRQPFGREIFPSAQQKVSGALDGAAPHDSGLPLNRPTQLVDLLVHEFDDVKTVSHGKGSGKVLDHGRRIRGTQVGGDRLDVGFGTPELTEKGSQGILSPSLGDIEHPSALPVDDDGDELVQSSQIQLVDGQELHLLEVDAGCFLGHVALENAFDRVPSHSRQARHVLQAHHSAESCNESLKAMSVGSPSGGKRGEESKNSPHLRHWHRGTCATMVTGLKPIGTVRIRRSRVPRRAMWSASHFGHRMPSRFALMWNSTVVPTYFVLLYSQPSPIPKARFKNVASIPHTLPSVATPILTRCG